MTMRRAILLAFTLILSLQVAFADSFKRSEQELKDWQFRKDHEFAATDGWTNVTIPHDWAIYGPFDKANDLQTVAVIQNGEEEATEKTGRTGGLPYMGKGCYRTTLEVDKEEGCRYVLLFDGAMSEAQVLLGGEKVFEWPYGYNSFYHDVTEKLSDGANELVVLLENRPFSSRWYPGAGLYRKVRLVKLPAVHVPIWGTYVTTPHVGTDYSVVRVRTEIEGAAEGEIFDLFTRIIDCKGSVVAQRKDTRAVTHGEPVQQNITVADPSLWSPENPALYHAVTYISKDGAVVDSCDTRFGFRSIEIVPDKGFFLNGELRKMRGVCLHHDLGPLGTAINKSAIRHQLEMLKDMGCDAIRTSHNMPAEELVELCDEMGFIMMLETFDEWDVAKCDNGYHRFFDEWAEKDIVNMVRHFRNNPSVLMWSIGNEVPTQWTEGGYKLAAWMQDICHREDPTRPVTCGMDQFDAVVNNGFAALLDFPSFNYKPRRYIEAYGKLPQNLILASESASTVSSRGVYHFPAEPGSNMLHEDNQSSSYDNEYCYWSNIPDVDFAADEDYPWVMGQFVWTGFDYLGEPSPYDTDAWPNHSSVFGIIDLASIPKDRYYLYRSLWNHDSPTLHLLPHWTWPGREGLVTPVVAYTSYPSAELFVNGVSQGVVSKNVVSAKNAPSEVPAADSLLMNRFRLIWPSVLYEPGEIKVVAYDKDGHAAAEETIRTAGKAYALKLTPWVSPVASGEGSGVAGSDQVFVAADGEEICYVNVSVVDRDGNPVPTDSRTVNVSVSGCGSFRAIANGDPTSLESFQTPSMHLFSGQLTVLVQAGTTPGPIRITVSAKGLKSAAAVIDCR